jgi:uncharacterized protein YlaI
MPIKGISEIVRCSICPTANELKENEIETKDNNPQ